MQNEDTMDPVCSTSSGSTDPSAAEQAYNQRLQALKQRIEDSAITNRRYNQQINALEVIKVQQGIQAENDELTKLDELVTQKISAYHNNLQKYAALRQTEAMSERAQQIVDAKQRLYIGYIETFNPSLESLVSGFDKQYYQPLLDCIEALTEFEALLVEARTIALSCGNSESLRLK